MPNEKLSFLRGTAAAYEALEAKSDATFYYTTDTKELYLGEELLSNGADLDAALTRIAATEGAVALLNGDADTEGSVRNIMAEILSETGEENFQTLKEITDWIESHPDNAAEMNQQIADLGTNVETLAETVGEIPSESEATNVVDYAEEYADAKVAAAVGQIPEEAESDNIVDYLHEYVAEQIEGLEIPEQEGLSWGTF